MNYQARTKAELIDALHLLQKEHDELKSSLEKEILELQNREGLYHTILNASPDDVTVTDLQGKILLVSDAALRLFKIARREDVLGHSMMEYLDPADRERAMLNFLNLFQGIGLVPTEYRGLRTDGSTFDIEVNGEFVRDAKGDPANVIFVVRDISERKDAEKTLKKSQMLLKSSIESQKDTFFFSIDRNYEYLLFNKVHVDLMKLFNDRDIKVGMNFLECIHSVEDRKAAKRDYERVFQGESFSSFGIFGGADPVYYEGFFNPILNDNNEVIGATTLGRDITGRKKVELALKASEEKFKALFENMEEGFSLHEIITDENGLPFDFRYLNANVAYERHTGMKAADCIGKTIREVIPQADPVQIEAYGKVALTGEPLVFEYFSKTFNRHIKVRAFCPQPGQFATIFEDITERKVAEEALRQSEENLNVLFNVTDESIFLLDKDRTIIWLNKVAADRFGRSLEEIAGCKISTLLPPDILDRRRPFIDNAINNKEKVRFEDERDGRWIVNNLYPILNEAGQVTRLAIYSRDITERKQREEEIKQKNSELHLLNAEKDKFFSILAHDLRSPFSSLLGFAQMMEEDLPTMTGDQVQKIAGSIKRSATNLFTLLENLLEWSRLQRGMISFTPSSFLLKPWLHENMMLAEEAAKKKDITINYEIPVDLLVYADEKMLGGLVRNLTSNSVKFTPKGGKVCVAARLMPDGWVEIRVQDSGIGMSKEMIADVFRLDVDTRRKGTEKEPSTGLGLIICKEFVEKHSGKFWIESEAGKGSTFYFTIPGKGLSK